MSTVSKGNYYKRKSKEYYEKLGYTVQLTEFMCAMVVKGKCFYRKIDIFGSDGIAMNGTDIIFWNSKHIGADTVDKRISYNNQVRLAKREFDSYPFPKNVKRQIIMWEPRKKPEIIEYTN